MTNFANYVAMIVLACFPGLLLLKVGALHATKPKRPQQFVYTGQASLPDGDRVGLFLPRIPVALGLQSKSGSRVFTVGEILHCEPFQEEAQLFRKDATGAMESVTSTSQFLNCGPPFAGAPDRILGVVGIQWRDKED
jgi:hypothetical protein